MCLDPSIKLSPSLSLLITEPVYRLNHLKHDFYERVSVMEMVPNYELPARVNRSIESFILCVVKFLNRKD